MTLRSRGIGRWFAVGFPAVWLAFWAAGEVFALAFLGLLGGARFNLHGVVSLPTGLLALGMAAFILVWIGLWTLGGVAAAGASGSLKRTFTAGPA